MTYIVFGGTLSLTQSINHNLSSVNCVAASRVKIYITSLQCKRLRLQNATVMVNTGK